LAGAPAALADPAGSATASGGAVTATLWWSAGEGGVTDPRITIRRAGVIAVDRAPIFSESCSVGCRMLPSGDRESAVQVVDLDGDGEPEVLSDAFTGGPHCCALTEIDAWSPAQGAYLRRPVRWGNGGYEVRDLDRDGTRELVGADDRFSARYTAYAFSARPVRILHFTGPGLALRPVTRRFPSAVRADLAAQRRLLARSRRGPAKVDDRRGVVAALVADLYTLGRAADARAQLQRSRRAGDLGRPALARSFRRALLRDLDRWGYR